MPAVISRTGKRFRQDCTLHKNRKVRNGKCSITLHVQVSPKLRHRVEAYTAHEARSHIADKNFNNWLDTWSHELRLEQILKCKTLMNYLMLESKEVYEQGLDRAPLTVILTVANYAWMRLSCRKLSSKARPIMAQSKLGSTSCVAIGVAVSRQQEGGRTSAGLSGRSSGMPGPSLLASVCPI